MKLTTGLIDTVENGDEVAIVRFDQDADETIYVGTVKTKKDKFVETTIPGNEKEARYEILALADGHDYVNSDTGELWIQRFQDSTYELYLKAEKRSSGDIRIDGV